jgi:hypothetical protein
MRFKKKACGPGGVRVRREFDLKILRGGELVSPVGCVASKLSGLDLPTPDARHRRPLKFFSENRGAKFLKITSEAVGAGG